MDDWDHLLASSESLVQGVSPPFTYYIPQHKQFATPGMSMNSPTSAHIEALQCTAALVLIPYYLQDPLGMPRVSRTMDQVQQLSERMVSRIQHRDTTNDGLASARLLAQQGVNQRQYVQQIQQQQAPSSCMQSQQH